MLLAVFAFVWTPVHAQEAPPATEVAPEIDVDQPSAEELERRTRELEQLQEAMERAAESRRQLESEIAVLQQDRASLNSALIDTTTRIRETETRSDELERRLETLLASEAAIRRSLEARRGIIIEVLAALQRMGRRPPPAVLVRPEDILEAVRTSMLLGAVVPELRAETEALAADLSELVRLRTAIAADQTTLSAELASLDQERLRLAGLIEARQMRLRTVERDVAGEAARVAELAGRAATLKDLIDGMEAEITAAREAAEAARAATEMQLQESRQRFAAAAFLDPARLSPQIPFAEAQGMLPQPVSGEEMRAFGAPDGYGGTTRGISISTRPGEIVTSPADGWVAFSGPFRSFGRLLIINAGDGYYVLLAGMDTISVDVGQFVLAGEPVATMGASSTLSPAAGLVESDDPVLYVEFRKDGGSIDPSPWWQEMQGEKVRG
ncbi:MAG TPA: peptidoglycan DD-metalloendopeptidase family protein [Saliniramus sp.]|nr:peptidoglycan DD-metalloendopeptidase family protein [Saliniramus sp.]